MKDDFFPWNKNGDSTLICKKVQHNKWSLLPSAVLRLPSLPLCPSCRLPLLFYSCYLQGLMGLVLDGTSHNTSILMVLVTIPAYAHQQFSFLSFQCSFSSVISPRPSLTSPSFYHSLPTNGFPALLVQKCKAQTYQLCML